jgi:hypothetical protein
MSQREFAEQYRFNLRRLHHLEQGRTGLAPLLILLANSLFGGEVEARSAFRLQGLGFRPGGFHVAPPDREW